MNNLVSFNSINFSLLDLTINFAIGVVLLTLIPLHYSYSANQRTAGVSLYFYCHLCRSFPRC